MWRELLKSICAPIYWRRLHLVFDQPHDGYLLDELAKACGTQADTEGLETLTEPQKVLVHIWSAGGIIGNGGFRYFFESGLDGPATVRAYDAVGLPAKADAVRRALEFFPSGRPSKDFEERIEQLAEIEKTRRKQFESLNGIIWGTSTTKRRVWHVLYVHNDAPLADGTCQGRSPITGTAKLLRRGPTQPHERWQDGFSASAAGLMSGFPLKRKTDLSRSWTIFRRKSSSSELCD